MLLALDFAAAVDVLLFARPLVTQFPSPVLVGLLSAFAIVVFPEAAELGTLSTRPIDSTHRGIGSETWGLTHSARFCGISDHKCLCAATATPRAVFPTLLASQSNQKQNLVIAIHPLQLVLPVTKITGFVIGGDHPPGPLSLSLVFSARRPSSRPPRFSFGSGGPLVSNNHDACVLQPVRCSRWATGAVRLRLVCRERFGTMNGADDNG